MRKKRDIKKQPNEIKRRHEGWYHDATTNHFGKFIYCDVTSIPEGFIHGPFWNLRDAKEDAIAYYETDISMAKKAIKKILDVIDS